MGCINVTLHIQVHTVWAWTNSCTEHWNLMDRKWLFWMEFYIMRQLWHVEGVSLTMLWLPLPGNISALETAWILPWELLNVISMLWFPALVCLVAVSFTKPWETKGGVCVCVCVYLRLWRTRLPADSVSSAAPPLSSELPCTWSSTTTTEGAFPEIQSNLTWLVKRFN